MMGLVIFCGTPHFYFVLYASLNTRSSHGLDFCLARFYPEWIRFVLGTAGFLLSSFSLCFWDDDTLAVTVPPIKPLLITDTNK
jgi:hypothetical protein